VYLRSDTDVDDESRTSLLTDVESISARLSHSPESYVVDGDNSEAIPVLADAVVPLIYQGNFIGLLLVRSDDMTRVWADNELLLLHTVADQLAVAVNRSEEHTSELQSR